MIDIRFFIEKDDGSDVMEEFCTRWPCVPRMEETVILRGVEYEVTEVMHDFDQESGAQVVAVAISECLPCDCDDCRKN